MRKKSLLLVLIFSLFTLGASAQVVVKYQQGFETTGESYGYNASTTAAAPQSTIYSSGNRALKLTHSSTDVIVELDTIDFTDNGAFYYFVLEFMGICDVNPFSCANPAKIAYIEYKRPNESTWSQLMGQSTYDRNWGGGSSDFVSTSSFSQKSYGNWQSGAINNTWWKKERFNIDAPVRNVAQPLRKLQIRFVLAARTTAGTSNEGWYIDNITVKTSPQSLAVPVVTIQSWPDIEPYPNSRSARIEAKLTTSTNAGMDNDSIYLMYRYGHDDSIRYITMDGIANQANRYRAYIPFEGYDTMVYYRLIARDATANHNKTTYPLDEAAWAQFYFTRGKSDSTFVSRQATTSSNSYPFSGSSSARSQFVYDSATLAAAGIGPGAITMLQYTAMSGVTGVNRQRFQIKMANIGTDYAISVVNDGAPFYLDPMRVVYDSSLSLTQNANTIGTIHLQDTFFYAGKSMLVQITSLNPTDPRAMSVATFPAIDTLKTLAVGYPATLGTDPFTSATFNAGTAANTRPNFLFKSSSNLPLIYDAGISGFVNPTATVPANAATNNDIQVWLRNYGVNTINAIRIYYQIDDSISRYYDWTGTLGGLDSIQVTINNTQRIAAGHHYITAWVDDSLTSANVRYRDHEPFNDTVKTRFVSCDGPMNGIRTVGTPTADFATLEQFIYSVNQCGVNGPLRVKLAPGTYFPEIFLNIPGASNSNYVQFEPDSTSSNGSTVEFKSLIGSSTNTNYLVNLQATRHVRFKDIRFITYSASTSGNTAVGNTTQYAARMSINSRNIHFINCYFEEELQGGAVENTSTTAHIYSGGADSVVVDGCTFIRGEIGVDITGPAQDNLGKGARICNSFFSSQKNNALIVRNQEGALVDHNNIDTVTTNASYTVIVRHCYGATRITRNTIYSTTGASCLGTTDLHGDATNYAVVANNMLVSNDDGSSNMLTTALNIIRASYTKVLYNSVKLIAPSRDGIAAATLGGDTISEVHFYNNIITCFDTANFAFNYLPVQGYNNYIGNNIYYSRSNLMNKHNNISCTHLGAWLMQQPSDTASQNVNPGFINSNILDLRTYSQFVKGKGIPFAEVTNDINDTVRSITAPCVGAFEFASLNYDFEVVGLVEPNANLCGGNNAAPLHVAIFNSGVNTYADSSLILHYMRGTTTGSVPVTDTIFGADTIVFNTNNTVSIPGNGNRDTSYVFTFWLSSSIDPNPANDTSSFVVYVNYTSPAPGIIIDSIPYGSATTVIPTNGIETWYPEIFQTGSQHRSAIYWYRDTTDSEPFHRGDTLITNTLYTDTTFYIRQKRDLPLVKITQVQINKAGYGATYPMPFFMANNTNFAVQLTNVGDYPAHMLGDTLMTISNTSALKNKVFVFPDITIEPGESFVLQYARVNNPDSSTTLGFGSTVSAQYSHNFAILYRDGEGIKDAVAFNGVTSDTSWTNRNVRSTVWSGNGITLTQNTAGVYRTAWPHNGNATPTNFAQYWQVGDSVHSMNIGATNNNLIIFTDNGCEGAMSPVYIRMNNVPNIDLSLDSLDLPTGCALGNTPISIDVANYGVSAANNIAIHYSINGNTVCTDTINTINSNSVYQHTFTVPADFFVASGDSIYNIKVWVDAQQGDNAQTNDTSAYVIHSYYTPAAPILPVSYTTNYATRVTMQPDSLINDRLIWYNSNMEALDTTNCYTSDFMYHTDSFFVSAISVVNSDFHIGELASLTTNTNFPSPYNPSKKYVKEQYIYTANELIAAGHTAGNITGIAFNIDTLISNSDSAVFDVYKIAMGTTADIAFSANNDWHEVSTVAVDSNVVLYETQKGWITHTFDTPFIWNGTSNIVVQVLRTMTTTATGAKSYYTTTTGVNSTLSKNDNTTTSIEEYSGNGNRANRRPDIMFTFADYGCEGPHSTVVVNVVNIPDYDAELAFDNMNGLNSCGNYPLRAAVMNHGDTIMSGYRIDYWLDGKHDSILNIQTAITAEGIDTVLIDSVHYMPGTHTLRMAITMPGDSIVLNDTIETTFRVSFCAGTYTIGAPITSIDTVGDTTVTHFDFPDFTTAVSTLSECGINGLVIFDVQNGIYEEQVNISNVPGNSTNNSIIFRSATGNPTDVELRAATSQASNYVLNVSGDNVTFRNMTLHSLPASGTFANVVTVTNATNVHFVGNTVRVKGGVNNTNASGFVIGDNVNYIYIDSCVIDSGYFGILSSVPTNGTSSNLYIRNDTIYHFLSAGIHARQMNDIFISKNYVYASNSSRGLTGIFVADHTGAATIERNNVILYDRKNNGKRGIAITSVTGSNLSRSSISNNMVSIRANGVGGVNTCGGIIIDSSSYVNIYYNTVRVEVPGNAGRNTRVLSAASNSNNLFVMNNILDNRNSGHIIYAASAANIATLNYNVYYNDIIAVDSTTRRFGYWGGNDIVDFTHFRNTTGMDNNSRFVMPYYISDTNLHLALAQFSEMAQYNTSVPNDIDGDIRPQIPSPCIGADEPRRLIHDLAAMDIYKPGLLNDLYPTDNVESDPLQVTVAIYNNGSSTESNVYWYAEVEGCATCRSANMPISEILPGETILDTTIIQMPIGIIDTQIVCLHVIFDGDSSIDNNTYCKDFFLDPAYNFEVNTVYFNDSITGWMDGNNNPIKGCRLSNMPVSMQVTNKGRKTIPTSFTFSIGYEAHWAAANNNATPLNLLHSEQANLAADLAVNASAIINFQTPANVYPTGADKDLQAKIRSFITYEHDQKPLNDTSAYRTFTSKYTPNMPIGTNLQIPYGTWDTIFATQTDNPVGGNVVHRPIRWYNDSTDADPYFTANSYTPTTWWETPQYFANQTYYLSCISSTGCTSYYNPVHVNLNPRVSIDASIEAIEEPYSKVLMEDDTVKVRIINYGTSPISNIPVVYQVRNGNTVLQQVTETCPATIQPDNSYIFQFDSLVQVPDNTNLNIRVWTDLANEQTRLNDTIREAKAFSNLNENYSATNIGKKTGLDITWVAFSGLNQTVSPTGHDWINFAQLSSPSFEANGHQTLYLTKGTTDTLVIGVTNSDDITDTSTNGYLTVYIDYNRNGVYDTASFMELVDTVHIKAGNLVKIPFSYPYTYNNAIMNSDYSQLQSRRPSLGYMRMRVILEQDGKGPCVSTTPDFSFGCVHDYLIYVEGEPTATDAALTRVVSPLDHIIEEDTTTVTLMIANKGKNTISSPVIQYMYIDSMGFGGSNRGQCTYNGTIQPGQSVPVALPARHFRTGTTDLKAWIEVANDTNHANDTLLYNWHRFYIREFVFADDFEEGTIDMWYAPQAYTKYSENIWQRGIPAKTSIAYAYNADPGDTCALVTDLTNTLAYGEVGNQSIIYTPIFNIAQVRPDTISFFIQRAMPDTLVYMTMQYYNYLGQWVNLRTNNDTCWYTSGFGFDGNSHGSYERVYFSTKALASDFQQRLQFRFIFTSRAGAANGDGIAIDNFLIERAQRAIDVGVVDITYPTEPRFGETIRPSVVIQNFGYDTVHDVTLAYSVYGFNLARVGTFYSEEGIAPNGGVATFTFPDPFVVRSDFPDTFNICAYTTVNRDIYWNNDSTCKEFYLTPLDNDMGMMEILSPTDHIVAGDSITVTTRIRNYGQSEVSSATVTYVYNNFFEVTETIDFNRMLGRPLQTFEYFNYTFDQKCRASMGRMYMTAYVTMENDDYIYNDTIQKSFDGLSAIYDLKAAAIVLDSTSHQKRKVQLVIENVGALSANNFEVGFWYDNDPTTLQVETFSSEMPLAALHTAYHTFNIELDARPGNEYALITAYVHLPDSLHDNDPSNDTTSYITIHNIDLAAKKLLVVENRYDTCQVYIQVENKGNRTYEAHRSFRAKVTINGTSFHQDFTGRAIAPGEAYTFKFNTTIPKDPHRTYEGSGELRNMSIDADNTNNQTSLIEVINYYDGNVPLADKTSQMKLEQNYPNPYSESTRIDFYLPSGGDVRFFVIDGIGRIVHQETRHFAAGNNSITFSGDNLSTGTYYYGIEMNGRRLMRKMVFTR